MLAQLRSSTENYDEKNSRTKTKNLSNWNIVCGRGKVSVHLKNVSFWQWPFQQILPANILKFDFWGYFSCFCGNFFSSPLLVARVHTKKWTNITLRKLSDRSNHAQSIECARVIVYFLYNLGCVTLDRSWFSRSKIIHCIHNSSSHQHQPAQPCVFAKNYDANIK